MTFPDVTVDSGMSMDAALESAATSVEAAGFQVHRQSMLNNLPQNPLFGFAKVFSAHTPDGLDAIYIVHPSEWSPDSTSGVLQYAHKMIDPRCEVVKVVSSHEVPHIIQYCAAAGPRRRFVLDCLLAVQEGENLNASSATQLGQQCAVLLQEHLGVACDPMSADALVSIDDVVLGTLRDEPDSFSEQDGYVPTSALIALGCLAGNTIAHLIEDEIGLTGSWSEQGGDMSRVGLVLEMKLRGDSIGATNPIGKVMKLFEVGKDQSVAHLYASLKFMAAEQGIGK